MAAKAMKKSGAALEKLRADIKSGSPENVYIFYGEETYLRDRYLEELKALLVPEGFEEFYPELLRHTQSLRNMITQTCPLRITEDLPQFLTVLPPISMIRCLIT